MLVLLLALVLILLRLLLVSMLLLVLVCVVVVLLVVVLVPTVAVLVSIIILVVFCCWVMSGIVEFIQQKKLFSLPSAQYDARCMDCTYGNSNFSTRQRKATRGETAKHFRGNGNGRESHRGIGRSQQDINHRDVKE